MNRLLCSFILLVFFSLGAVAQNNKNQKPVSQYKNSKIVTYQLSKVKDLQQLNEIKSELSRFRHVTNVTVSDYSPEATITLKIYVTEVLHNEGDEDFNQSGVKQLLVSKGVKPSKLKIEEFKN